MKDRAPGRAARGVEFGGGRVGGGGAATAAFVREVAGVRRCAPHAASPSRRAAGGDCARRRRPPTSSPVEERGARRRGPRPRPFERVFRILPPGSPADRRPRTGHRIAVAGARGVLDGRATAVVRAEQLDGVAPDGCADAVASAAARRHASPFGVCRSEPRRAGVQRGAPAAEPDAWIRTSLSLHWIKQVAHALLRKARRP